MSARFEADFRQKCLFLPRPRRFNRGLCLAFQYSVDCWIGVEQQADRRLIRLAGRLSVAQVPELLEACAEARPVELNLADLVSADAGAPELKTSSAYLRAFKRRLAEAVESEKPVLPRWEAGGVTWLQVKAWRVKPEGLVFDAGSGPDAMAWSEIGTSGVESLARAAGLPKSPEDRLGLAVYYLCAGDAGRARALLDPLRGGPLEDEAARIQAKLGK